MIGNDVQVPVTVLLDGPTWRHWRATADRLGTDFGPLLAKAAARATRPRSPETGERPRRRYTRLSAEQRAEVLAEPRTPLLELARRYDVSISTISNIRKAGA